MNAMPTASTGALDVERIRKDFAYLQVAHPCGKPIAYLDSGASTQHPTSVLQAMQDCYEHAYSNVHRGIHFLSEAATERYESAREVMSKFIGAASSDHFIFTPGCTAAINLVAHGWGRKYVSAGDVVLTTQMEHHANIVPWFQLRDAVGCDVRFVPITSTGLIDLDALSTQLKLRPKLLAITAVSNVLGTVNPLAEIIDLSKQNDVPVLIDAAQAVPHMPLNVTDLDCDFFVFSGHKMLGPTGIGGFYAKPKWLAKMDAFMGGGGMIDIVSEHGFTAGDVPAKFEAGTPPIVEAVGLAAAAEYLQSVGLEHIHEHEMALTRAAYRGLQAIDGVQILGPDESQRSGIVSFVIDGIHAHDVAQVLDAHGVAVRPGHHCTMPLHEHLGIAASSRASFYLYNTLDEIQRLVVAVQDAYERFHRHRSATRRRSQS